MPTFLRQSIAAMGGVFLLGGLAGCSKSSDASAKAEWWRLEAERLELESEVDLAGMKAARTETLRRDYAKSAELRTQLLDLRERVTELERRRGDLKDANLRLAGEVEERHAEMLITRRASHQGRNFETFRGRDGRTYEDVRVKRVTAIGLEFSHSTGLARLTAAELTPDQRVRFGLELDRSAELLASERRRKMAFLREAERAKAESAELQRKRELARAEQRRAAAERRLDQLLASNRADNAASGVSDNPLDQPARPVGPRRSSSSGRSSNFYTVWGSYRGPGCYTPRRTYHTTPYRTLRRPTRRPAPAPAPCP